MAPGLSAGKPGTPSAMIHTWREQQHPVMRVIVYSLIPQFHWIVFFFDLVQRPHRDLGDITGDELPGGALRVAGGEALSVPQVTYMKTTRIY